MSIAVLLSGGVDSSVALHLLKQNTQEKITAFYLKIWLEDEVAHLGECPWEEDLHFAQEVCKRYQIPLEIIPMQGVYWEQIVETALSELKKGHTPSPDILCNQRIKFGAFMEHLEGNFKTVASGHYAQIRPTQSEISLLKGVDPEKDQTYFLSNLTQNQLSKLRFPIGSMTKSEVRETAAQIDLPNKKRRDSQGICFLGKIPFTEFVRFHLGDNPGKIVDWDTGKKLGQHRGLWFHTIGQRKGLGLGGGPWFTVDKDPYDNVLFVSRQKFRQDVDQCKFFVDQPHWILEPTHFDNLEVKLRHGPKTTKCQLSPDKQGYFVKLAEPDLGIASGQYAVFYEGQRCLGNGMIRKIQPTTKRMS